MLLGAAFWHLVPASHLLGKEEGTSAGKSEGAADGSGDDSGPRGRSCDSSGVPGEGTTRTRHLALHPPASPPRSRPRLQGRRAGRDPQKTIKSHGGGEAALPTETPSRTCPSCCSSLPTGIPQQPWPGLQQLPAWSLPSPWGAFVPPGQPAAFSPAFGAVSLGDVGREAPRAVSRQTGG